jgi:drug/metabolite transporter (DMT)-like permease
MVRLSYLGVILIWSTTPLAIQWSGQEVGFLFGVTGRMVIGGILSLALVMLLRLPMAWHHKAWQTYLAAGLGIYGAMMCVYWSAQFVPSGWISVLFGLTPITTGLLAARFLGEGRMTAAKLAGMLLGVVGLGVIFHTSASFSDTAWYGVVGLLVAVTLHSVSTVLVKHAGYQAHGLVITAGGLLVAVPLYLLTWMLTDASWPEYIPSRTGIAIIYLGVIATVIGFAMFFYVLREVDATRVALLTLITPVLSLYLGHVLNNEAIGMPLILGAGLILSGLALYEWGERKTTEG